MTTKGAQLKTACVCQNPKTCIPEKDMYKLHFNRPNSKKEYYQCEWQKKKKKAVNIVSTLRNKNWL